MQFYSQLSEQYHVDPKKFWSDRVQKFTWFKKWEQILDDSDPYFPKWFVGGEMNLCYDCVDRHVDEGHGDDVAFIFDSPYTKTSRKVTYKELLDQVSRMAGVIAGCGLAIGDRVLINMPMIYETVVAMLACCRLGLFYYIMMGSYTEYMIADRIDDFQPSLALVVNAEFDVDGAVFTKKMLDKAINIASYKISKCFVLQRPHFDPAELVPGRDFDIETLLITSNSHEAVPVEVNSPCFIIYTSGTTGKPKGIIQSIRGIASQIVHEDGAIIGNGLSGKKIAWLGSTFAWIVGQCYGCYMALFWRVKSIIYEGSVIRLDISELYRIISNYELPSVFISTAAIRHLMRQDPEGKLSLIYKPFRLQKILCGGAPGDLKSLNWAMKTFDAVVLQMYGLTEIGGLLTQHDVSNGRRPEDQPLLSSGKPVPGWDVKILRDDGSEAAIDEVGKIVIKTPLPPAVMTTIFRNDEKYVETYLKPIPGYFETKDNGRLDTEGYLYVLNRNDTVFKAEGHRISCTALEEAIITHPDIADCVVVTKFINSNDVEIEIPIGFFLLKEGVNRSENEISQELVDIVHRELGKFIPFSRPYKIDALPRTISGKVARGTVQEILRSTTKASNFQDPVLMSLVNIIKSTHH